MLLVSELIVNSFPVEVSPRDLDLPCIEYETWDASTADLRRQYAAFTIHRYRYQPQEQAISEPEPRIRMLLLSGPTPPSVTASITCNTGSLPHLTNKLIEHTLGQNLEERGMTIKHRRTETLALTYHNSQDGDLISFHTGISFKARQPHQAEPSKFTLTAQWDVGAHFTCSLSEQTLRQISLNMAVKYTPSKEPDDQLLHLVNRYLGTVISTKDPRNALLCCRDNVRRTIPYDDLTLEPTPQALRRYDLRSGTNHQRHRVNRRIQELSKVLTRDGRRNESVLTDRLHAIIHTLSGDASDQLVLPLCAFARGTVRIRLSPQRVWLNR